ncbi:MAG: enamine deaminase RidA [Streptosporangiaceae bacterium]|nr:enamine deaminase RidA [Streptosporangiaceae bacterium]
MNTVKSLDAGVAHQIGRYADAVLVPAGYQQIFVSGTPGLTRDGTLPEDFTDESTQAWRNVEEILSRAGAGLTDIVSIRQWLIDPADIPAYVAVRSQFIKHEPASMLAVIPGLVRPEIKVEVEVIAVLPPAQSTD